MTKFKVGDVVECCGVHGVVRELFQKGASNYPIGVTFEDLDTPKFAWFTFDGKIYDWHKEPSLKLVERPKQKVKKTMYQAILKSSITNEIYSSRKLYSNELDVLRDLKMCVSRDEFVALGPAIEFEVEE